MSVLSIQKAFLTQLKSEFPDVEILYENKNKKPKGGEFLEAFLIPVSNESTGKASQSTQDEGIFQVTVAVSKGKFDTRQLELVDRVFSAFGINTFLSYNSNTIEITEYSVNAGREVDGFYKRDVSINYLTFS